VKAKEEVFMMGDINDDALIGELTVKLGKDGVELREVSHLFWSGKPPASHVNGREFIVLVASAKRLEVTQLLMLPHFCSVGNHRSWIVELTTRSVLGPCNSQRTPGRILVTTNHKALCSYSAIVRKKFNEHKIIPWLDRWIAITF